MTEATVPLARASRPRLRLPGLHQASALYLLVAIFMLFGLWIPNTFLTATTFKVVGGDQVVVAVLALALLIPLTAGVFDLSVGNMLAFSLVIVSWFQANTGLNGFVSSVLAVLACGAVGFVSGLVVVRFRVDSFIATLGMSQILAAGTLYISSNKQIVGVLSPTFLEFGRKEILGIPVVVYYLVALALVIWYVLAFTPLGRHLFATGANAEAARLSGVRTDRMVWGSLVGSGVIAGVAGVIYGAKIGSFSNSFGPPLLFPAFAAVFFGSTQFKSRPNVWGTLLAVYTLAFGVKGLQLAFASGVYWITPLFNGVALVLAVALAARSGAIARRRRSLTGPSGAGAAPVPSNVQSNLQTDLQINGALSGASPVEAHGDALRT